MNIEALQISIGKRRAGVLFRYRMAPDTVSIRFVADTEFANDPDQALTSLALHDPNPLKQAAIWADVTAYRLNGTYSARNGWLLPAFFQNLLPEGALRQRLIELRGCDAQDHFELLAATGRDLPGNVYAEPVHLDRAQQQRLVTQDNDALEMSVTAEPMEQGVSVSGVQPKLAVIKHGERYVARTKLQDAHIIAKLPVVGYPLLPELEALSLQLAAAAGVRTVSAWLEPLTKLACEHGYDLGEANAQTQFLAVQRYDRDATIRQASDTGRVHAEDFAQILGVMPEDNYSRSYLEVAAVMLSQPSLGEAAVHELLKRIFVNELLGNPDMHLKNIGVWYPDGRTPELPPAYDIVGYAAYSGVKGRSGLLLFPQADSEHAPMNRLGMGPAVLRAFCARLGLVEKPASTALRRCARLALAQWPTLIDGAAITPRMKDRLNAHFLAQPAIASLFKRQTPG
jgi:serine/threonine-protein kinase HipA